MGKTVYEGTWEEISEKQSAELSGHRVEVRIVEEPQSDSITNASRLDAFRRSTRRIEKLTKGKGSIEAVLGADDFYGETAG